LSYYDPELTMHATTALRGFFTSFTVPAVVLAALAGTTATSAETRLPEALSLSLATDAVMETINVCAAKGYRVAVAVVDPDGVVKLEARGDGSPIHSQRFSFRKAYTIVSMGPMFGADTGGALVTKLRDFPSGLANVQSGATDLLFLAGSALIKSSDVTIGAIGVSGAPLSSEDEACAQAGLAKIRSRLERGNPGN
jgi:uncharacterized protein GlcG (DUF336 family)